MLGERLELIASGLAWSAALLAAGHALVWKRDPRAAWGWIGVCLVFPLLGSALYILFGVNRTRRRAVKLLRKRPFPPPFTRIVEAELPLSLDASAVEHARLVDRMTGRPIIPGNRVWTLEDGEAAYPAMLDAIRGAKERIALAVYIFEVDAVGRDFAKALGEAKARGVEVRVVIDGAGEFHSWPESPHRMLAEQGVEVARFLPPRLFPPQLFVNLRLHHKILVVDGESAFTGGMNLSARHLCRTGPKPHRPISAIGPIRRGMLGRLIGRVGRFLHHPGPTADLHFRIDGPAAAALEESFLWDYGFAGGKTHSLPPAEIAARGTTALRPLVFGPDDDPAGLVLLLASAVNQATRSIDVMTPYFIPPRELVTALGAAAMRGVRVRAVIPARSDHPIVHRASRAMWWELLQWGVRILVSPPPFAHTKLFVVDEAWALIGSVNWDQRSLRLNFENVVEVYDRSVAAGLARRTAAAAAKARPVSLAEVDRRPLRMKIADAACKLFSPYL